jgi:Ser/Thr protein kinase RdoA (MazF antagonist)
MKGNFDPATMWAIAAQFAAQRPILDLKAFGNGNINDTFLVTVEAEHDRQFILQRINTQVFAQPAWVMQNMRIVTEHIHQRLQKAQPLDRPWETPRVLLTQAGFDHWTEPRTSEPRTSEPRLIAALPGDGDDRSDFWRAISFIDGSEALDAIQDCAHAQEVGYALGQFHHLISDLDPTQLADTLEGFHITPRYVQQYDQVLASSGIACPESAEFRYGLKFVHDRKAWASVLETAKAAGKLPLRLMHGDPKVNNVMIDRKTQQAISLVDLDTVKPGLIHYDIGDCVRSACNPLGEETQDWRSVYFDLDLCRALLQGYLNVTRTVLTEQDFAYLFDAIRVIAFELGLRFLTDYLAGNVYFKVKYPEHNLMRALVQFQLTASIEDQEGVLRRMIQEMS